MFGSTHLDPVHTGCTCMYVMYIQVTQIRIHVPHNLQGYSTVMCTVNIHDMYYVNYNSKLQQYKIRFDYCEYETCYCEYETCYR